MVARSRVSAVQGARNQERYPLKVSVLQARRNVSPIPTTITTRIPLLGSGIVEKISTLSDVPEKLSVLPAAKNAMLFNVVAPKYHRASLR